MLLSCLVALAVLSCVAYYFSDRVLEHIVVRHVGEAQFLHPMEAFSARLKLALLLGFIAGLPFIAFEVWSFVVPGLMHRERRLVVPLVASSVLLFLGGVAFSYFWLTPTMMSMLVSFGTEHVKANISVGFLLDFVLRMAMAAGLLFQLPLVVAVLSILDLVSPRWLLSKWRHAVVLILVLGAVVTPGDGPSQLLLAAPIIVLYFLSILVSLLLTRGRDHGRASPPPSEGTP